MCEIDIFLDENFHTCKINPVMNKNKILWIYINICKILWNWMIINLHGCEEREEGVNPYDRNYCGEDSL